MNKDKTIVNFVRELMLIIDMKSIQIVDHWDADLCAIGLAKGNKLIYVSTYNYINEDVCRYDYDLETLKELDLDKLEVVKEGVGVSETELIHELRAFLDI